MSGNRARSRGRVDPLVAAAARAHLAAFLAGRDRAEAVGELAGVRGDRVVVLRAAHAAVTRRVRVTPEAAGFTLVAEGGLSVGPAAEIAGASRAAVRRALRSEGVRPPRTVTARDVVHAVVVPAAAVAVVLAATTTVVRDATAQGPVALEEDADRDVVVSVVTAVEPDEVPAGGALDVTVAVVSGGTAPARDVVVTSQLADELHYVEGTAERLVADVSGTVREAAGGASPAAGIDLGDLPAGSTAQVTYRAAVDPAAPDGARVSVASSADVAGFGRVASAPAVATVVRRPVLAVLLTSEPAGSVPAGGTIAWLATVRNVGTVAAEDVRVVWRPDRGEGATRVGRLPPGTSEPVTVRETVPREATGDTLRARVEVVHASADEPVASEVVAVTVVGASLPRTGVPVAVTAAVAAALVAVGVALLSRPRVRRG